LQGEGFLQEGFLGIGREGSGEGILSVAGEVKDFYFGTLGQKLFDEFVSAEAGHHNVGDDEMNCVGVSGGEGKSCVSVAGFEDAIATAGEGFADELADRLFVLDQKDSFGSAGRGERDWVGAGGSAGFVDAWKINRESGAAAEFTLNEDVAAALLDDAVNGGESKAGAFAFFFGGKKRLEDASLAFRGPCLRRNRRWKS